MKRIYHSLLLLGGTAVGVAFAETVVMPPAAIPGGGNTTASTIVVAAPNGQVGTTTVQPTRNGQISGQVVSAGVTPATFQYQRPPGSNLGKQVISPMPIVNYPTGQDVRVDTLNTLGNLQLTPEQINQLKILQLEKERARAMPYPNAAEPVVRTLPLDLSPGKKPPALRLSMGMQTSVVFSDAAGNAWMIDKVSLNRTLFSDGRAESAGATADVRPTNVLTLEPLTAVPYGNVTVTLKGMTTPIILILTAGQNQVDARVDAKVPGHNPDAYVAASYISSPQKDEYLGYFLDGVPPTGAKRLQVSGGTSSEAWTFNGHTYLKTSADVQFPAYLHGAKSTTGVNIYRFAGKPSSVTLLAGGRATTVFIE